MDGTLRFSDDGPEFPGDFVDSLLAGDVIFLCGTSVSAPQMPDFPQLVESTYPRLAIERTDSEQFSFDQGRLEEVLGSLNRRLSDPDELTRGAFDLLAKATPAGDNASLWSEFLVGLALGDRARVTLREELAPKVFDHMAGVEMEFLKVISSDLAVLIMSMKRIHVSDFDGWLKRLWAAASVLPQKEIEMPIIYERAIDAVAGKVAHTLLTEIDSRRKQRCHREYSKRRRGCQCRVEHPQTCLDGRDN